MISRQIHFCHGLPRPRLPHGKVQKRKPSHRRSGCALTQIYESKPNPPGGFQWSLKAPEADLKGLSGEMLGKHGAGPSWTMNDGSSIVGNLPPLEALGASKGVPWLLVSVKSKSGFGILNQVDYVVRVAADGGVAPAEPPKTGGETIRVRYRAIYLFLHKA